MSSILHIGDVTCGCSALYIENHSLRVFERGDNLLQNRILHFI